MDDGEGIPLDGLTEVLRGWSGRGQLYGALAEVLDRDGEVRWQRQDIEGRAHRILLGRLEQHLLGWPGSAEEWLHALPAQSLRNRRISDAPQAGTDWVETRKRGWPPRQFVVRQRSRIADRFLATTLRWTIDRLAAVRKDAIRVERSVESIASAQITAALSLRGQSPLDGTEAIRPDRAGIRVLMRSGPPWTRLAPVTEALVEAQSADLLVFARQDLFPDPDIRWRLFHLAVLGVLLRALRERGATITSLRPLSGAADPGPSYAVELNGRRWDLWFEAAAIWSYYGQKSPYQSLVRQALGYQATPLGADILLIAPRDRAYAFECKYGETAYTSRHGYLQAMTYGDELRECFAPRVASYVVAKNSDVVRDDSRTLGDVTIGIIGPRHIRALDL